MSLRPSKPASIGVIFLTVFLDLVGFGIVLPLLPVFSKDFGAAGWLVGVIMASFSAMQFLLAPAWGRLSDRIGRRPVMLVSLAASAVSYAVFAIGCVLEDHQTGLWVLLASRLLAGACGANITVAQAYVADITPPESRSKRMGLIGMAFGLGFIFGPLLGLVSVKTFGMSGPGLVAGVLCALNFVYALVALPESWKPASEHAAGRARAALWGEILKRPHVGLLIHTFGWATFAFACFETTMGLLAIRNFHLDGAHNVSAQATVGYLYAFSGVVSAVVQGGLIGRLVKRYGEVRLILFSLGLTAAAMMPMPWMQGPGPAGWGWTGFLALLAALSVGTALTRPPLFGLMAGLTPAHEQGVTIGVAQSMGGLARIAGPVFAGMAFDWHPAAPYLVCGVVLAGTAWAAGRGLKGAGDGVNKAAGCAS